MLLVFHAGLLVKSTEGSLWPFFSQYTRMLDGENPETSQTSMRMSDVDSSEMVGLIIFTVGECSS